MNRRVAVNGGCGRMGQEVVKTIVEDTGDELVGVFDKKNTGENIIELLGLNASPAIIRDSMQEMIDKDSPDIIIDFTSPAIVAENIKIGLDNNIHMIIGTTGLTAEELEEIEEITDKQNSNVIIAPNFALGAVLLMKYAADAARYLKDVEIIELHHDQKLDAPSGTAIKTARLIEAKREQNKNPKTQKMEEIEKIKGVRGGLEAGIPIHSVRLQGLVAHQEVIFGGEGQTLTFRHDSYDRSSFMPGVRLALDKITEIPDFVYGLENLLE